LNDECFCVLGSGTAHFFRRANAGVFVRAPGLVGIALGVDFVGSDAAQAAEYVVLVVFRQVGDEHFFKAEFFADAFFFHGGIS